MQRKPVIASLCCIVLLVIAISISKDGRPKEVDYPEQKIEVSIVAPDYLQPGSNVIISWEPLENKAFKAEFGGIEIPIIQIGNEMFCLAGIGARKPSGLYNFVLYEKTEKGNWQNRFDYSLFFNKMNTRRSVLAKEGKKRKGFLEQYQKERVVINQAMDSSEPNALFTMPFLMPLKKMFITGPFGTRRYYNSTKRTSIHAGLDLRARTPIDVYAINTGEVMLAREFTLEGNFVAVDHL